MYDMLLVLDPELSDAGIVSSPVIRCPPEVSSLEGGAGPMGSRFISSTICWLWAEYSLLVEFVDIDFDAARLDGESCCEPLLLAT